MPRGDVAAFSKDRPSSRGVGTSREPRKAREERNRAAPSTYELVLLSHKHTFYAARGAARAHAKLNSETERSAEAAASAAPSGENRTHHTASE